MGKLFCALAMFEQSSPHRVKANVLPCTIVVWHKLDGIGAAVVDGAAEAWRGRVLQAPKHHCLWGAIGDDGQIATEVELTVTEVNQVARVNPRHSHLESL